MSRYWPFSHAAWRAAARAWPTVVVGAGAVALLGTAELTLADTAAGKPLGGLLSLAEMLPLVLALGIVFVEPATVGSPARSSVGARFLA